MALVLCEVRPGMGKVAVSVAVQDTESVRTFLQVERDFLTLRAGHYYLPVGLIRKEKEQGVALIEFPFEADSGEHRIWVPLASLLESNGAPG